MKLDWLLWRYRLWNFRWQVNDFFFRPRFSFLSRRERLVLLGSRIGRKLWPFVLRKTMERHEERIWQRHHEVTRQMLKEKQQALDRVDRELRPYIERIMAVQFETKWYYPILPTHEDRSRYFLREAAEFDPAAVPLLLKGVLDTRHKLILTFAVADEVLLHMLKEAPEGVVDDYFVNVGKQLASKAVKTIRAVQKLPPKAIEAVLRCNSGDVRSSDSGVDGGGD